MLLRLAQHRRALRGAAAITLGLAACLACGAFRAKNLPLDDAYIHLSYGLDFSWRTIFSFQAGERDTGTSSWLWTAIAVVVTKLHLPEYAALTLLSTAIFCALVWHVVALTDRALPRDLPLRPLWPWLSAALVAANGNALWLSLTGMETSLSVLLLLVTVPRMLAGRGMTMGAGLLALAAVWTRIEAVVWIALAAALMPFIGDGKRARRGWIPLLAGLALYIAYNQIVGGHALPTSGISKRSTFVRGGHSFGEEWGFITAVSRDYVRRWLPGWAVEIVTSALAGLWLVGTTAALRSRRGLRAPPRLDPDVGAVAVLTGGALVHTALNIVEFRTAYHHMRYFAPIVYLVPALAPTLLLRAIVAASDLLRPRSPFAMAVWRWAAACIALPITIWALVLDLHRFPAWRTLHLRNAEQLGAVHLSVGRWLREEGPPGVRRVASFDIGALRWASRLELVDLAGTTTARTLAYRRPPREPDLVRDAHADVYVSMENGWDELPLSTPAFSLELIRTWQFPEYHDPFPPHSRRMIVYRVNHCGEPRLVRENVGPALTFDIGQPQAGLGTAEGTSFTRWPVGDRDLGHRVWHARGRFLASDASPLRDRAVGTFETIPMKAEGDFLSFRMAGGHDPARLRVELRSGGAVLEAWTGWSSDAFLEIVRPISELRGKTFTLAVVDAATGRWGHLLFDQVQQFVWREAPAQPCPKQR